MSVPGTDNKNAVSLKQLKADPSLADQWKGRLVYIYSGAYNRCYGKNYSGYPSNPEEVGVYTFEDAFKGTCHCGPEKYIEFIHATTAERASRAERAEAALRQIADRSTSMPASYNDEAVWNKQLCRELQGIAYRALEARNE